LPSFWCQTPLTLHSIYRMSFSHPHSRGNQVNTCAQRFRVATPTVLIRRRYLLVAHTIMREEQQESSSKKQLLRVVCKYLLAHGAVAISEPALTVVAAQFPQAHDGDNVPETRSTSSPAASTAQAAAATAQQQDENQHHAQEASRKAHFGRTHAGSVEAGVVVRAGETSTKVGCSRGQESRLLLLLLFLLQLWMVRIQMVRRFNEHMMLCLNRCVW
jgi:hypothetical protein